MMGVVGAYVTVSLALGGTPLARPVFQGGVIAWALFLAAVHWRSHLQSPTVAESLPANSRQYWPILARVEVIAFNLVLTLVLAELAVRAFAAWAGTSLIISDTLDAHRLTPGQDYGGGLRGNALGYPGADFQPDKRLGVFRIAALGDSFAIGPAVPFADNYLTFLETKLPGVEVYNFGVSGAGPREYQAILHRDVWAFQPDLVLLSIFVGNDITETLATPRYMDPRQNGVYLLLTRGWRLARENWRQRSSPPAGPKRLPAPGLSPKTFREVEARRLEVCLRTVPGALEKKWRRVLTHLEYLATDCRRREVPLAVVLIPDEFQVNPAVLGEALEERKLSSRELDLELPQRRLAGFFRERGVRCLDLLPIFRGVPDTYALRDTHWNVRGNRLAAREIARWLR
jgi:hypothetical protein